jgi:hypothetical protein
MLLIPERIICSIRFEEGVVNSEGCLHAFGSCCDDKLHTTAGISGGIEARDVGSGVFAALNTIIILAKFAAKLLSQMRALVLSWGEKQRASWKELAVGKPDSFQLVTVTFKPGYRRLNDPNRESTESFQRLPITCQRAIGAEHQVLAPKQQLNRELDRILIATRHCNRLISTFPTIAIWTAMHGAAVKLFEVFDFRQVIDKAGCKQKHTTGNSLAGFKDGRKSAIPTFDIRDFHLTEFDGLVAPQLIAADFQEFRGVRTVTGKKPIEDASRFIPRMSCIAHKHAS